MASLAAKARARTDQLIARGQTPEDALRSALELYPGETGSRDGTTYARFPDRSFMALYDGLNASVITYNSGRSYAAQVIDSILLQCEECGRELWCDHRGRGRHNETFEFGDAVTYVCAPCQHRIVKKYLVGE